MPPSPQSIQKVLGGEVRGNTVHAPTPGHSRKDRGTSVTVDPGAPDGVVVHCFNGGDPLEVKDTLRDAGVLPPLRGGGGGPTRWREAGVYVYDDGGGKPIYRTRRLERDGSKKFVAERLEAGEWVSGLGDCVRLPYRFTELCEAAAKARETGEPEPLIYFVEGERKADKLASWGLLATAIAFGANGWREEYGEAFAGGRVVILPDNDVPGVNFAETVKAGIEDYGGEAVILELPGLPPKGDIVDWDGSRADLEALTAKAWAGEALPLPTLDLAALADIEPRAKAFAIERVAPLGEVTLFTGAGSAGKSLLGQQIATCAASGLPCLGLSVIETPAVYLSCEDDQPELHFRLSRICGALGVGMAGLAGKLHLSSLRGALDNELAHFEADGTLKPSAAFGRLVRMMKATAAKIVILDNVAHLFTGNENDRGEVTRFVNLLNRLAGDTGAAVLLIGHPNKSGDSYSGSTAWLNAVRSQVFLEHDLGTDLRTLTVGKANYAAKGEAIRFLWLDGAFVREEDLPPDRAKELDATIRAVGDNELFLKCLAVRNAQERPVSESEYSRTFAPLVFSEMAESKRIGRKRLIDAMDRLFRIERIGRGTVCRTGGKDREGLVDLTADPRADLRADLSLTPSADLAEHGGADLALTHPITT